MSTNRGTRLTMSEEEVHAMSEQLKAMEQANKEKEGSLVMPTDDEISTSDSYTNPDIDTNDPKFGSLHTDGYGAPLDPVPTEPKVVPDHVKTPNGMVVPNTVKPSGNEVSSPILPKSTNPITNGVSMSDLGDVAAKSTYDKIDNINELKTYLNRTYSGITHNIEQEKDLYDISPYRHTSVNNVSVSGKAYVLFGRPDLNLFDDTGGVSLKSSTVVDVDLEDKILLHKGVARLLDRTNGDKKLSRIKGPGEVVTDSKLSPFIALLSNMIDTFNMPDKSIDATESSKTLFGAHVKYPAHSDGAVSNSDVSISFRETAGREVYHLFDIYTSYMEALRRGGASPRRKYLVENMTDYDIPIYVIITAEDGMTVTWWAKFISAFPTSVPAGSFDVQANQKFNADIVHSINFHVSRFAPTTPRHLIRGINGMALQMQNLSASDALKLDTTYKNITEFRLAMASSWYVLTPANMETRTLSANGTAIPVIVGFSENGGIDKVSFKILWLRKKGR